jgi:hypothetical protein
MGEARFDHSRADLSEMRVTPGVLIQLWELKIPVVVGGRMHILDV